MMQLKQLEVFVHVARLKSFSKAADALYLTQPTISAHVSALEGELGTKLVVRSTKRSSLPPRGISSSVMRPRSWACASGRSRR